jgi:hypothetical protein
MRNRFRLRLTGFMIAVAYLIAFGVRTASVPGRWTLQLQIKEVDPAARTLISQNYGKLPLSFEENLGQTAHA